MRIDEDYEVIEYTREDMLWHEYYEPIQEFFTILKQATIFLLTDGRGIDW